MIIRNSYIKSSMNKFIMQFVRTIVFFFVLFCSSMLIAKDIPVINRGGVYHIPVEINRIITLDFIIDTGASEVNIPADVVLTLYRAGTIRDSDFLPGQTYVLADGSMLNSSRFILRSLKIGNSLITNVPASIGNISSSLLLGQSFLRKLGSWGIDNKRNVLIVPSGSSHNFTGIEEADPLYRDALKDYERKDYAGASEKLLQFLKHAPNSPQTGNALYYIGDCEYAMQRDYECAVIAFHSFLEGCGQDSKAAAAMLKQAYCWEKLYHIDKNKDPQSLTEAKSLLQQVQKKFPHSPEAQKAAEKLKQLEQIPISIK
jgi:hypothetical protein